MNSINEVTLTGAVAEPVRVNTTATGASVANVRLKLQESYTTPGGEQRETVLFLTVTVWKANVPVAESLKVGDEVWVRGKLVLNRYVDEAGTERSELRVSAFRIVRLSTLENVPSRAKRRKASSTTEDSAGVSGNDEIAF